MKLQYENTNYEMENLDSSGQPLEQHPMQIDALHHQISMLCGLVVGSFWELEDDYIIINYAQINTSSR